ncbi:MAG: prepilin-type N-terminal cleavage/methylation domain-containing protein [Candidatus Saccharibacteria bacterium]|nr:prepilin-type N-terminal cleavage/methylation domain-containing protein [Candidatus Saccharibacteria bacterium]
MQKVGNFSNSRGFTIVELLIVIVIIGILAALVIVAYNGITDRANNTQTESAMGAWRKAMIQYATDRGSYPISSNACFNETNVTGCWPTSSASTTLNNALRPYLGNQNPLPAASLQSLPNTWGADRVGGGFYYNPSATLDGVAYPYYLAYNLKGKVRCNISGILSMTAWPVMSTTAPTNGRSSDDGANMTFCILALPDPTKL